MIKSNKKLPVAALQQAILFVSIKQKIGISGEGPVGFVG